MNTLSVALKEYLELRRKLGSQLRGVDSGLQDFVAFAKREGASYITTDLALRWAQEPAQAQPVPSAACSARPSLRPSVPQREGPAFEPFRRPAHPPQVCGASAAGVPLTGRQAREPAHTPAHHGHASVALGERHQHDQLLAGACGHQLDASLCGDRHGDEAKDAGQDTSPRGQRRQPVAATWHFGLAESPDQGAGIMCSQSPTNPGKLRNKRVETAATTHNPELHILRTPA